MNLGLLYSQRNQPDKAEAQYQAALALDPGFVRAYVNLADLYRSMGREADGEKLLREALQRRAARSGAASHARPAARPGRSATRRRLPSWRWPHGWRPPMRATPTCYAVALDSTGKRREALKVLEASHRRHPADRDTLLALATINRDLGAREAALRYGQQLLQLLPAEPGVQQLVRQLQGGS